MNRRSFLLVAASGVATAAAGSAAGIWRWKEISPEIDRPGQREGHWLRDHPVLPPVSRVLETDVAILGSGVAGLTAAWKLRREGFHRFMLVDGPHPYGNAAAGSFEDLVFPTGAHYLPAPSIEAFHVRELLHDLGVLLGDSRAESPQYDERFILHAPEERVFHRGSWQEGLVPSEGIPSSELAEMRRFSQKMEQLRNTCGSDGRRVFVLPAALSSTDPVWRSLDRLTFREWLINEGYTSPTLFWYANYCCRDDYGASADGVSAWAGLHYFCSRSSQGGETESEARLWLTWPDGLHALARGMEKLARPERHRGMAARVRRAGGGAEVLCVDLQSPQPKSYLIRARTVICAMPLMVSTRIVEGIGDFGFEPALHLPEYAPWIVANFLMRRFPRELPKAPLCWDNVVYDTKGLGYVVSTHQLIRASRLQKTVFTAYHALTEKSPKAARAWMTTATASELLELASSDLRQVYGHSLRSCVERVHITLHAHAMAIPRRSFLQNTGLQALCAADGPVLFAHSDLSGFSVFEEASWWGYQAAVRAMNR